MRLDLDRIRAIIAAPHSFYGSGQVPVRKDARLNPGARDFIGTQLDPSMHVLDIGCGSGETLLLYSDRFRAGVGIDTDPVHLQLAQQAQRGRAVANVEFLLLDVLQMDERFDPHTFDFVISQRGPVGPDPVSLQAALRVLRPNRLLFCELIGDLHHQEARELFEQQPRRNQMVRTNEEITEQDRNRRDRDHASRDVGRWRKAVTNRLHRKVRIGPVQTGLFRHGRRSIGCSPGAMPAAARFGAPAEPSALCRS